MSAFAFKHLDKNIFVVLTNKGWEIHRWARRAEGKRTISWNSGEKLLCPVIKRWNFSLAHVRISKYQNLLLCWKARESKPKVSKLGWWLKSQDSYLWKMVIKVTALTRMVWGLDELISMTILVECPIIKVWCSRGLTALLFLSAFMNTIGTYLPFCISPFTIPLSSGFPIH